MGTVGAGVVQKIVVQLFSCGSGDDRFISELEWIFFVVFVVSGLRVNRFINVKILNIVSS